MKLLLFICLVLVASPAFGLPAFPGAQGMGADTVGGRGGAVCIVDTLSDDTGDGNTFRDCVETASGARYVVFRVSGIIDLTSQINITNPYLTIAGETSPGGIVVTGWQTTIKTHDVIIRHMRFRLGAHRANDATNAEVNDALNIWGNEAGGPEVTAYNIIIDHCSMSWGLDETASVNYNAQDVTFSWCFITSGLLNSAHPDGLNHSAGFIAWGGQANPAITASLHHTFMGYNYFRNPENNADSFLDSVNNVAYYFQTTETHRFGNGTGDVCTTNVIGNYYKTSGSVSSSYARSLYSQLWDTNVSQAIYMSGNLDGTRTNHTMSEWTAQRYFYDDPLSTDWQRATPWPTTGYSGTGIPVTASVTSSTYASYVVANAGATKPVRDGVDIAAAANYEATGGAFTNAADVDTLGEISALVNLSSPSAPTDSDNDGMADSWETSVFGDLTQAAAGDYDSDGYDNIEEYFHYMAGKNSAIPTGIKATGTAMACGTTGTPISILE